MTPLEQIASDYHYHTEHYDRLVCSGIRHGCAVPVNAEENHKIQVNARLERITAIRKGQEMGFSADEVGKAISHFGSVFNYEKEHEYRNRNSPNFIKGI